MLEFRANFPAFYRCLRHPRVPSCFVVIQQLPVKWNKIASYISLQLKKTVNNNRKGYRKVNASVLYYFLTHKLNPIAEELAKMK